MADVKINPPAPKPSPPASEEKKDLSMRVGKDVLIDFLPANTQSTFAHSSDVDLKSYNSMFSGEKGKGDVFIPKGAKQDDVALQGERGENFSFDCPAPKTAYEWHRKSARSFDNPKAR